MDSEIGVLGPESSCCNTYRKAGFESVCTEDLFTITASRTGTDLLTEESVSY